MTKLLIAEKNGWIYDPESSIKRLNEMQKKFPILLRGGGVGISDLIISFARTFFES